MVTIDELSAIKFALRTLFQKQDIKTIFSFVFEYLYNSELYDTFLLISSRYKSWENNKYKKLRTNNELDVERENIFASLLWAIRSIESDDLKNDCLQNPLFDEGTIDSKENTIIIPKFDDWVSPIESAPNGTDEKMFKFLMRRCQDELAVGHYTIAYQICTHIRNDITTESYQLYEYMLFAYFNREGVENIIADAIESKGNKIRHLIHYIKRYNSITNSKNLIPNITWIGEQLIQELRSRYKLTETQYNYILNNSKSDIFIKLKKEDKENAIKKVTKQTWLLAYWMQKVYDIFEKENCLFTFFSKRMDRMWNYSMDKY